jgi:hypothetical protein
MVTIDSVSVATRMKSRRILIEVSRKYDVAPAVVVSHIRTVKANAARKIVQQRMIQEQGLSRAVVAMAFGRDLRRVRASVIDRGVAREKERLWSLAWEKATQRALQKKRRG